MATTLLASRNQTTSFMGDIPNYPNNNNNHRHHLNPNPNPKTKPDPNWNRSQNQNQKPKSRKKQLPNGRGYKPNSIDSGRAGSEDAYSFNRPIETGGCFNYGGYVTYNVNGCSRSEIYELRKKLVYDLERIRTLNERIEGGEVVPRLTNGKVKKLAGNKRGAVAVGSGGSGNVGRGEGDEGLMKMCRQVLTKLMKHKMSWVFKAPVDAEAMGLHDYKLIVKRPMDLGTVKMNLGKNVYLSPVEFAADVRLVFENAMLYNPKTDKVYAMADQLLTFFEGLFRPIQEKLGDVNVNSTVGHSNGFSAVDEFDGSSWDDIRTPGRPKKQKTSAPVAPFIPNKRSNSTASNLFIPPVVQSPVRMPSPMQAAEPIKPSSTATRGVSRTPSPMLAAEPVKQSSTATRGVSRTPSPMQATEPVKPSSTATRGGSVKLPKPRAKDQNKRDMNLEEKQKLGLGLQSMPPEKMPQLLQIIRKRNDQLAQDGDEIELDIEALDTETLWELDRFVTNWKKDVSKKKRQALLVTSTSAYIDNDIDDVPFTEAVKKNKKEAGEEDVDIGDEMPESSFPHVEIEKDDGGGQVQATTGPGNENASSSSSGSSSSSSGDSSSSSDSGSGSSSGSDSDADEAQS